MDNWTKEFFEALLNIDQIKAAQIFEQCYRQTNNFKALENLTIKALEQIGTAWEEGEASLSQVYMSGVICEKLIGEHLWVAETAPNNSSKMAIGVLLDHHDLGKKIVSSILKASGYTLLDFGKGLSVSEIVQKAVEHNVEILLISTLMLNSALKVRDVKDRLAANSSTAKIITGGAPFRIDPNLWDEVGADANSKNASDVIATIAKLTGGPD